jgi:hypothetical protein
LDEEDQEEKEGEESEKEKDGGEGQEEFQREEETPDSVVEERLDYEALFRDPTNDSDSNIGVFNFEENGGKESKKVCDVTGGGGEGETRVR